MSIEVSFEVLADEWANHCKRTRFSSSMPDYLNHDACRKLVMLGRTAIPAIMERYQVDSLPWSFVLQEITGLRMIEDLSFFSPADVKARWLHWWDEERKGEQFRPPLNSNGALEPASTITAR